MVYSNFRIVIAKSAHKIKSYSFYWQLDYMLSILCLVLNRFFFFQIFLRICRVPKVFCDKIQAKAAITVNLTLKN